MRNKGRIVAAVVALAIVVFVLRYTVLFDAEAWLSKLAANTDEGALVAAGQRLHVDASSSPCLRYTRWDVIDDAAATSVAGEVAKIGLDAESFAALAPKFAEWIEESERSHHSADAVAERIELLARDEAMKGVVLMFNRSKLRHIAEERAADAATRSEQAWAALTPQHQQALRDLYETNRAAFTSTGQVRVLHALAGEVTRARLSTLTHEVTSPYRAGELDAAAISERAKAIPDGWQGRFAAEAFDGGVVIWSNGADRMRGGEGPNVDHVRWIPFDPNAGSDVDGGVAESLDGGEESVTVDPAGASADELDSLPQDARGVDAGGDLDDPTVHP